MQSNNLWKNGVVLSFDLDTENLRKHFNQKHPENAYSVIRRFLEKNGFEHLKDSDYKHHTLDKIDSFDLLRQFTDNHEWFRLSLSKMILSPNITQLDITAELTSPKPQTEAKQKQKAPIPNIDFSEIKDEKTLSIKP